jgi:porphobilinogen deaminase
MLGGGCHLPLGCLATTSGDELRLQAVLGEVDEAGDALVKSRVSRVAAVAPDAETAARACFEALRLAAPEVVPS